MESSRRERKRERERGERQAIRTFLKVKRKKDKERTQWKKTRRGQIRKC
jgi:hypothetical protein